MLNNRKPLYFFLVFGYFLIYSTPREVTIGQNIYPWENTLTLPDGEEVPCQLTQTEDQGHFDVSFLPTQEGDHSVEIFYRDIKDENSPYTFGVVSPAPSATGRPLGKMIDFYRGITKKTIQLIKCAKEWNLWSTYRVIKNFASPSRSENRQASAKLTISPSLMHLI